jgi:hypothetical protein
MVPLTESKNASFDIALNASKVNSIYGSDSTGKVQIPSLRTLIAIRY